MHFKNSYIDFHCHPSLKPFGKSFNKKPVGIHSSRRNSRNSIWRYDPPSLFDKLLNMLTGLTKYSQANFTSLAKGGVSVVCVSLYPLEKWFVRNKIKNELIADLAANFALGVGDKRIDHIQGIKDYFKDLEEHRPFFVTLAHHFWNHLCGHAESLTGIVKKKADQSEGLNTGFTALGRQVVERLLETTHDQRILIDIKHMSPLSRNEYYQMLASGNAPFNNVPIVISHGACNGLKSSSDRVMGRPETAKKLNAVDINFFDDEIIKLAKSGGIFGLQLDERRISSKQTLKDIKHSLKRSKIMHYRSELLWNQIQHIVELLDAEGLFAWDIMAIGSDFDGIIDSLNGFWTSEELPFLADFLERHAFNYMNDHNLQLAANILEADEIVSRIMTDNGTNFLKKHFNAQGAIV